MSTSVTNYSLFELDRELDLLLNEIQTQAEVNGGDNVSPTLIEQFQEFCQVYNQKVDRIWTLPSLSGRSRSTLPLRISPAHRPGTGCGKQV